MLSIHRFLHSGVGVKKNWKITKVTHQTPIWTNFAIGYISADLLVNITMYIIQTRVNLHTVDYYLYECTPTRYFNS